MEETPLTGLEGLVFTSEDRNWETSHKNENICQIVEDRIRYE